MWPLADLLDAPQLAALELLLARLRQAELQHVRALAQARQPSAAVPPAVFLAPSTGILATAR